MSMQMDVDGQPSEAQETDDLENYMSENEICGICRDVVIDRGVLDGCQHWFCYTCIDNWSAITNRCPLCKVEFQHITCTPVYDSTGAGIEDNRPLTSDDDDWYVQGESNTLSFPSYYIDAEAVVCLDGGDCMIRSGLVSAEDDSTLDTSIACDSCDLWYHAICVGFNPEITSEDSWLCPRCVYTEAKNKSDVTLKQSISEDSDRTSTDASFSGRVSVSVADDGETALVVSMVGVNSESKDGLLEGNSGRSCNKSPEINLVGVVSSEPTRGSSELSPIHESAFGTEDGNISNEQLEVPHHVPSDSLLCGSKEVESTGEEAVFPRNSNESSPVIKSAQLSSAASKLAISADIDMVNTDTVQQVKSDQDTHLPPMQDRHNTIDMESESEISHPAKKARLEVPDQEMHLIANSGVSSTDGHTTSIAAKAVVSDTSNVVTRDKYVPDIMSIVEGDSYMKDPGRELAKPVGRRAGDKPGLRMKKIFHKEGKESSVVVQKLQQEIREVVRDNGVGILEKDNAFDEKLLTAFRAAIGKSMDGPDKRPNSLLLRKSLLQKGKIRENLTKKLYATPTGRRRNAWHRDREVDFWKHRCSPGINPEKIETLQSVLQLLKKSSDTGTREESAEEKKAFLSRLYLADASVVPRKGDIKPLSALEGCPLLDKNSQIKANDGKSTIKIDSPNSTRKVSSSLTLNKEASSRRENKNGQAAQNQQNQSAGDIKLDKRKWALEVLARKNASSIAKDQAEGTDDLSRNYPLLAKLPVDMRPQLTPGRHNKVPMSVRQAQLYRITEHYLQRANLDVIRRCADTELAIADAVNVENNIYGKSSSKSVYVNLCSQATRQSAEAKPENDPSTLAEKAEFTSDSISQQIRTESTSISSSDVEETISRAGLLDLPATAGQADNSELGGVPEQNASENTVSFNSVEEALKRAGLFDSPPNSPERKITTAEGNSSTVSVRPTFAEQKYSSAVDTSLVNLDSEPSKSSDSRVRDASPLKDDDDSSVQVLDEANCQGLNTVVLCKQPKCDSEENQKSILSGETTDARTANKTCSVNLAETDRCNVLREETSQTDKGTVVETPDGGTTGHVDNLKEMDVAVNDSRSRSRHWNNSPKEGEATSQPMKLESSKEKSRSDSQESNSKRSKGDKSSTHPAPDPGSNSKVSNSSSSVYKKVEMFVKENIRSLCKSGVITVEQYRWAVVKTAEKVMKHHYEAKNANFLIKEGDKVKKLALQYVEAAQQQIN
uniref:Uncharacterized protein n=1 Tax=Avena sativa TaxID=4498 RepID=A0ACD5T6P6_AVESA